MKKLRARGFHLIKTEKISPVYGSRKNAGYFLELSKLQLYLLFHGIFIGIILLYQGFWIFSGTTDAYCYAYNEEQLTARGETPGTLVYHYKVHDKMYRETTTRNELPLTMHHIRIQYLKFMPSVSRPDHFMWKWTGFIIAWGIFFVISTMIFFIPNETMPRNSFFYFSRKRPWIHMIVK